MVGPGPTWSRASCGEATRTVVWGRDTAPLVMVPVDSKLSDWQEPVRLSVPGGIIGVSMSCSCS